MRTIRILLIGAAALAAGVAASAQPPEVIEGEPHIDWESGFTCPDPPEPITRAECCRITVTVDDAGKALSSSAQCTLPSLEATQAECAARQRYEPRIRTGGKREGYTNTFTQIHLPGTPHSRKELEAMLLDRSADKRCDDLPHA